MDVIIVVMVTGCFVGDGGSDGRSGRSGDGGIGSTSGIED